MTAAVVHDVAVVGAGPAGAIAAAEMARSGARVLLLDFSQPRHKPCSGFLTRGLFDIYPPLKDFQDRAPFEGPRIYTSQKGRSFTVRPDQAVTRFDLCSRRDFDAWLLEAATAAGAEWKKEKVLSVERASGHWSIITDRGRHEARALIGADGARSLVRKTLMAPIGREDMVVGLGRRFEGSERADLRTFFLSDGGLGFQLPGRHFSQIVVGCRLSKARLLRRKLNDLIRVSSDTPRDGGATWVGLQPSPISKNYFKTKVSGDDWCLIGDAAGHDDALNGEGIPFAVMGALEAARAFAEGGFARYDERWRDRFGQRLELASVRTRRAPGPWVNEIMAWALARSPRLLDALSRELSLGGTPLKILSRSKRQLAAISWELLSGVRS